MSKRMKVPFSLYVGFAMLGFVMVAAIWSAYSHAAPANTDQAVTKTGQIVLLEDIGTVAYRTAGNKKDSFLNGEIMEAMGLPAPVSLTELRNTIQDNEIKAEAEFPGPFLTFAHIDRVTRVLGTPAVRLTLADADKDWRYGTVTAFFGEGDLADLARFEPGNWLTVVCESWSYSTGVALRDCELLPTFADRSLERPIEVLKRACSALPEAVMLLTFYIRKTVELPGSQRATFEDELWGDSYFRRTGMIASSLGEMQVNLLKDAFGSDEGVALTEKLKAKDVSVKECREF